MIGTFFGIQIRHLCAFWGGPIDAECDFANNTSHAILGDILLHFIEVATDY